MSETFERVEIDDFYESYKSKGETMSTATTVPATARDFWKERLDRALALATDAELSRMANHFSQHTGAVFHLEIVHEPDHTTKSCATVVFGINHRNIMDFIVADLNASDFKPGRVR